MRYAAYERLIAPARATAHPLRLLAGVALVAALFVPAGILYAVFLAPLAGNDGARTPPSVLVLLLQFVLLALALSAALRLVHRRGLASLIGPPAGAARQFLRCIGLLLPLYLLFFILPVPDPYAPRAHMAPGAWLSWLPLALLAVGVQVGAEEMVFRGYLQSQLAARFSHPAVWIGLPSALFGLMHYAPGLAGDNAWMLMLWATLFGAAAADLTARAGTLGPGLALHFVNNAFAILVAAPAGGLDGLALYTVALDLNAPGAAWTILPVELAVTLCAWLTARLALRV